MMNEPVPFTVAPITRSPVVLLNRNRFASDHRFVDRARAFNDNSIHRDLLARTHAQEIADLHLIERHIFFSSVVANAPRGFWRKAEQALDCRAGLAARFQLQNLAQQAPAS